MPLDLTPQPQLQLPQVPPGQVPPEPDDAPLSDYWGDLDSDDLGKATLDRYKSFKEWLRSNGLIRGWLLKQHYYHNEFRNNISDPHLAVMQQFGAQGEFQFVSVNKVRSTLKAILGSVVQNPPQFSTKATNTDANAKEAAALFQGVLDYYKRTMRLDAKTNKVAEIGMVVDQAYLMVEWDFFASTPQKESNGIWAGDIAVKVLYPWDVAYSYDKTSWSDLDWIIVRDWIPRQKVKSQFPEFADAIKASANRSDVMLANRDSEGATRYEVYQSGDLSEDIQVFKLFMRSAPWMGDGNGRFAMFLDNGTMIYESPGGLVYPRIPVVPFAPDWQVDILLGYSPINEIMGLNEGLNTIVSSCVTNSVNYANQYIATQQGSELNPKTLETGQRVIEYPAGAQPPQGLNLTAIPPALFDMTKEIDAYISQVPGVSNVSLGQSSGANATGSKELFLASQTAQNAGNISENYAQFVADSQTLLLHVLRVFGRTERTIEIMGQMVASKTIVLADALKDFDEVVVDEGNPTMDTPQGKAAIAQQLLQYGDITARDFLQVLTSGNLNAADDPAQEASYYLDLENEWLLEGKTVTVLATDDHEAHITRHTQLFNRPEWRLPELAQQLGDATIPAKVQGTMAHIQQHMQMLSQSKVNTAAGNAPGAPVAPQSKALGDLQPRDTAQVAPNANAQASGASGGPSLPNQPQQPSQ